MLDVSYEVKKALKKGVYTKNYIFYVLNTDGTTDFTIDNNNLVKESVKIDERMCSDKVLKFGLCEGSSIEFQYFGFDNITGRQIKAFCSVQYKDSNGDLQNYSIPMGYFTIEQCSTQFSTGIIKAVGYNKLMSNYLDQKANSKIIEAVTNGEYGRSSGASLGTILNVLLNDYTIEPDYTKAEFTNIFHSPTTINTFYQNVSSSTIMPTYIKQDDGTFIGIDGSSSPTTASKIFVYVGYLRLDITISNLDSTGYYRIGYNANRINEIVQSLCPYGDEYYVKYDGNYIPFSEWYFTTSDHAGKSYYAQMPYEYVSSINNYNAVKGYIGTESGTREVTSYVYDPDIVDGDGNHYKSAYIRIPICYYVNKAWDTQTSSWIQQYDVFHPYETEIYELAQSVRNQILSEELIWIEKRVMSNMEEIVFSTADAEALPDVTLRQLQSAVFETQCQYGKLDRETDLFAGVSLNNGGLYPSETLYPADTLYPNSGYNTNVLHPFPSEYEKLWTDTVGTQTFKYLIITYKDSDGNEATLQRTVNSDGTTNYNMSDNWLFKNLNWSSDDVGTYADAMVTEMQNISWFPFEMWAAGLPYVETGDLIEITDKAGNTYPSYILQRQLNGIQNLQDTYINGELDIF